MKRLNRFVRTLWRDQRGLTTVEYAVAGAVIAAVVVVAFKALGGQVGTVIDSITNALK
jgi:pilus assembly protein Flp/PilA